jgi:predicted CXXCH cytochrome family protein
MRSYELIVAACVALALSATAAWADSPADRSVTSPLAATNTCATCHANLSDTKLRSPAKEFAHSVHRDDRIGCVGCHGGDPRDPTAGAHAKARKFRPHPTHAEIAPICGGCHSDAAFMRRLNGRLPVGQRELFELSLHGRLSSAGDDGAPTCATCHGEHDILPPSSPLSPVNRANVAERCASCHADAARMSKYDIRTDQFAKWRRSVHGEAFALGDANAPTCTGCHGAHSSTPPDALSVGRACGRCHETEMASFEQSPHSKGFRNRGLAQCVACHGNHDIAPATALMVGVGPEATCMKCHANDEKPRQVAADIADRLRDAATRAATAREAVARAASAGLHVTGARYALDRVTTAEMRVRAEVHTLDPARVRAVTDEIAGSASDALRLVADAQAERAIQRRGYFVALGFACLLLVTLSLKALELDRRRRREAS